MSDRPQSGVSEQVSPLIRRVLADNPGPFTGWGTGTFIVGRGEVAVIDPGPDDSAHLAALLAAVAGERVSHVVVTHNHRDHSPLSRRLAEATGAAIVGAALLTLPDGAEAGFDADYAPDRVLMDGEAIEGADWTLSALATPGHTSNHLAFALPEEDALFSGDHVMGWATTIVSPPDGDMGAYMASLEKLLARDEAVYHPTHGPKVEEPRRLVRGLILHRRQRESAILSLLAERPRGVPALVTVMYAGVDARLHPAAERSVLAHLLDLTRRGEVRDEGALWSLA